MAAVSAPSSPTVFSDLSLSRLTEPPHPADGFPSVPESGAMSWGPSVSALAILTDDQTERIVDFRHAPDGKMARDTDGSSQFRCYLQHSQIFKLGPAFQMWVVDDPLPGSLSKTTFSRAFAVRFRSEEASNAFFEAIQDWKAGNNVPNGIRELSKNTNRFDKKIESSSAKMYFHYYGQLLHQQNMLQDYVRTGTYYAAIIENYLDFQGRIVVDVGAGSGILSLFAAQAGAKHVYAVEASEMAEYAKRLIAGNPSLSEHITVIHGKVEEVELPEKADILVSEPMGTLLVNERMLESYIIARDRFLVPGGKMFPEFGRIHMAPFSDDYLFLEVASKALFWQQQNYYGVDLTALHGAAFQGYFSQPVVDAFDPRLLVASAICHTIDFLTIKEEDLYEINIPLNFIAATTARVHGLACWFDVLFNGSIAQRWLTTAPGAPTTHWYQLRCVLSQPLYVMAGQIITGHLHMVAHSSQSYTLNLTMSVKMWGSGPGEGGALQSASGKLELKEPYYRMSQAQAYSWTPEQQQLQLQQQVTQSSHQQQQQQPQNLEPVAAVQQPSTPAPSLSSSMFLLQQQQQQLQQAERMQSQQPAVTAQQHQQSSQQIPHQTFWGT